MSKFTEGVQRLCYLRLFSYVSTCDSCIKDSGCGFCYSSMTSSGNCLPTAGGELSLYGRCNSSTMGEAGLSFAYGYCPSQYNWITVVGMALFVFLFSPGACIRVCV